MKRLIAAALVFIAAFFCFAGTKLEFKYSEGDNFALISTVSEDVKVNSRLSHHAEIVSRVTERVDKVDGDGRGHILGSFMTSEQSTPVNGGASGTWKWGENFESEFWRAKDGRFEIESKYFMPVIRDLPVFPDSEVSPGDEWTAEGYEAEDLRRDLNVQEPFKVPFTARYRYERDEEGESSDSTKEKRTFIVITAKYALYYETPLSDSMDMSADYPVATMGYSDRTIWWDSGKGQIDHYEERFRIVMETLYGNQYEFSGTTKAAYTEFKRTATEENVKAVIEKIDGMGLKDISVSKTDKGLMISVENIQFKADSAVLEDSEKEKLLRLGEVLSAYPDNDLLVTGHTARAGSEESCQILSEKRAEAVADFLAETGVRAKNHLFTQGFGSKVPVASNLTERGKSRNRRVEITILDK